MTITNRPKVNEVSMCVFVWMRACICVRVGVYVCLCLCLVFLCVQRYKCIRTCIAQYNYSMLDMILIFSIVAGGTRR